MTSHIRHRRGTVPPIIEPGELHVDASNRQLVAGDIGAGGGVPMPMLAVRVFDARSSYAIHDYATQGGNLYRSNLAIPPGPFNVNQWTLVSGTPIGGTPGEHTPLHGYGDGANHTLVLHNSVSDGTQANSITFNPAAGGTNAMLFTLGLAVDDLRIQATNDITFAPQHVNFDDSFIRMRIGADDVVVTQRSAQAGGVTVQGMVNDNSRVNSFKLKNANGDQLAAMWTLGSIGTPLWVQSSGPINLAPSHVSIDNDPASVMLQIQTNGVYVAPQLTGFGDIRTNANLYAGYNLTVGTLAANPAIANTSGYLLLVSVGDLRLRAGSGSTIRIADTGESTLVGGPLGVGGPFAAAAGGQFQNDLRVYRSSAPNTGVLYLGTGDTYLYYNGADLTLGNMRLATVDPIAGGHVATKSYVDDRIASVGTGAGLYLPLAGGTMTGPITTAASGSLLAGGSTNSIQVTGTVPWSAISFHCPGVFATNFGLQTDGNFYMGGWSHGGASYQFWTTRDFTNAPVNGVRWKFAGDYTTDVTDTVREPFPGAAVTGVSFDSAGGQMIVRYRYLQLLTGTTWTTIPVVA